MKHQEQVNIKYEWKRGTKSQKGCNFGFQGHQLSNSFEINIVGQDHNCSKFPNLEENTLTLFFSPKNYYGKITTMEERKNLVLRSF